MGEKYERLRNSLAGRYILGQEVGRGGMSVVFLAKDLKHDRKVAIKVLRPELAAALGDERFLREIQIAARLQHPHILPLYDSGAVEGNLYYAMPYVEGESLRDRLNREQQLPLEDALQIAREVADALGYAHRLGVVHRDIKPENILISSGHALVADFGIARALDVAGGEKLTETGLAIGTPAYMSPEQGAGSGWVDGRSDLYALGCVLYEMLAGAPPFTGPTAQAILARHSLDPVPSLRTVRSTIPESVERAILKTLAKVPADRFATAAQFVEALTAAGPTAERRRWASPTAVRLMFSFILAGAAVVLGATAVARALRPAVLPSASVIAVLPFAPSIPDTALSRLGRDLVVTVSATLDQVGELRTVDRYNILTEADRVTPYSLDQAAAVSRRFGAGSFVLGSLLREGADVRLDLGVYRADDHTPLGTMIVLRAPPDSLSAVTDSIAWAVLRQVWRRGEPPSPSLVSVTTRSVPALRAFLEGELAVSENRWPEAADAFARARAADPAFWLAYSRYAESQWWREEDVEAPVLDSLRRHRDALSERDGLLVDARLVPADSASASLRLFEEATTRFPDYWPGWFLYGDFLTHFGPLHGHTGAEAIEAFRRVVTLNPRLVPAWQHLAMASVGKDTAAYRESMDRTAEKHFYSAPLGRLLVGLGRWQGVLDRSLVPLTDTVAHDIAASHGHWTLDFAPEVELFAGFPAAQIELNRRVLRLGIGPAAIAANDRGIALSWAARGAWDSALVAMDQYVRADPGRTAALEAYALTVLGAWLEMIDPAEAIKRRRAAEIAVDRLPEGPPRQSRRARLDWLDGVLAFSLGDRMGVDRARGVVRRGADSAVASFNDRSLAAFAHALAGDRRRAGKELAALEWECANKFACGISTYEIAIHRLAAAQYLLPGGDTTEATRLLTWHEAFQFAPYWAGTEVTAGLAYLERARLEEARGSPQIAAEYYRQFLRRYDAPMPAQRPLVEEARAALARLDGRVSAEGKKP